MTDFTIIPAAIQFGFGKKNEEAEETAKGVKEDRHFIAPDAKVKGKEKPEAGHLPHTGLGYVDTIRIQDGEVIRQHQDLNSAQAAQLSQALKLQAALLHHELFENLQRIDTQFNCLRHDMFDPRPHDVMIR